MNPDQLDRLGRISDKADNFNAATNLALPDKFHKESLAEGMVAIRDELRELYIELSGENPWEE